PHEDLPDSADGDQLSLTESAVMRVTRLEAGAETPIVEFRGVSKKFGSKVVLDNVDLAVQRGEVLVILGGSGAGKAVSLRELNGLDHPDSGRVLVDGTDISDLDEEQLGSVRRKVGMLFQSGALFDSMSVFENIAFALREHTSLDEQGIARRVGEVLGFVNLG